MRLWFILIGLALIVILIVRPKAIYAVLALVLVAGAGFFIAARQESREMSLVAVTAAYDTAQCSTDRPMLVTIINNSERIVERTLFTLNASLPGYSSVVTPYTYKQNRSDKILRPGESHTQCFPEPRVKPGALSEVQPEDLEWSAIVDSVYFSKGE